MATDTVKLFSTIKPTLLRRVLFRGTLFACLGVLILIASSTYFPPSVLGTWGILCLIAGGTLMVYGLIPYRRLQKIEQEPSELIVSDNEYVQLITLGKQQYMIPLENIKKVDYFEKGDDYGICMWLEQRPKNKIIVQNPRINLGKKMKSSRKKYGCDLFIPYFGRRAFTRLALLSCLDD